jgi:hypothetical protein
LTSPPETIPSCYSENAPTEFQPHSGRHQKEAERNYQKSLGRIPEQKGSSDPWGSVRSDSAPKAAPPKAVAKDPPAKRAKADAKAADTAK